jgi:nucleoside-diphosphate-sugar epimerase/quinol monooxygenase YgiN
MARTVKSQTECSALLLGVGYTARAIIPRLKAAGYHVIGTSRSQKSIDTLTAQFGIEMLHFDGNISASLKRALGKADILISSIPPSDTGDLIPKTIAPFCSPRWAGYLSATSVYGDRGGHWAFEDEILRPSTQRGKNRVEAELDWLDSGLPVHIFRLAGIYGPNIGGKARNPFVRLKQGKAKAVIKPGHVVNRIHVSDIASAVITSVNTPDPGQIYNLADGYPAPPQHVINFAADLLGLSRPDPAPIETAILSEMARSFYSECKRISPRRAITQLGWSPEFPTYRAGLMSILKSDQNLGEAVLLAGYMRVPDADIEEVKAALPEHIKRTRAEIGCQRFDVWQDDVDGRNFHVIERFASKDAFNSHQERLQKSHWAEVTKNAIRHYDIV